MKDRPILFSAPMVRAILAGTKTQTRRVVKPQPSGFVGGPGVTLTNGLPDPLLPLDETVEPYGREIRCPYGQPGDRLWVRETWAYGIHALSSRNAEREGPWVYSADAAAEQGRLGDCWRPSIHMRREASRITLEVTVVRVERLQEISEADAVAEGIEPFTDFLPSGHWRRYDAAALAGYTSSPTDAYASLWESINGPGSWDANPWVWAVEFKRVAPC